MKRTSIALDESVVAAGLQATGMKTTQALVDFALKQLLRREGQLELLKLKGKVSWVGSLDRMRRGRTR